MKKRLGIVTLVLAFGGCAAQNIPSPQNEADKAEHYASVFEELKSRASVESVACGEWCTLADRMSALSKDTCALAQKKESLQGLCVQTQEELARFKEQCARCR